MMHACDCVASPARPWRCCCLRFRENFIFVTTHGLPPTVIRQISQSWSHNLNKNSSSFIAIVPVCHISLKDFFGTTLELRFLTHHSVEHSFHKDQPHNASCNLAQNLARPDLP
ncbi:unnamed protein product [Ectocarpus sp. 8 AP-2014]